MNPITSLLIEFRWHLVAIMLLLTIRANVHGEESTAPAAIHIPTAVYALIDQADADVAKVHAALAVKLKKEQDAATKKGDLELALWLKAKVESLQPAQAQASGGNHFASGLFGKWKMTLPGTGYADVWTFTDKNAVMNNEGNKGTYRVVKDSIVIAWDIGVTETVTAYENDDRGTGVSAHGAPLAIERIK